MPARSVTVEALELPFPPTDAPAVRPAAPFGWDRSACSTFDECPMCGAAMSPEHAHFRCTSCGWRDSCCD